MPRILQIDPRVPTLFGVLIPRQAVNEQFRAYTTIQQARKYAKRIVSNAQKKADSLEKQALREGFQAGWLDSLNAIYSALADCNQLHQTIELALKNAVKKSLEISLQQPGLELQLLEGWLASGPSTSGELHVIVPHHAQNQIEKLKQRLEQCSGVPSMISVGESDNVIIQNGDQVYEFSPERTMHEMGELAHRCFQSLQVRKQCANWSARIVQNWLDDIEQRYKNIEVEQTEPETQFNDDSFDDCDSESALNFFKT